MKNYSILIRFTNTSGFLIRVALILERRGCFITSFEITEDDLHGLWVMDLSFISNQSKYDHVIKQLEKLVDVVSVMDYTHTIHVNSISAKEVM